MVGRSRTRHRQAKSGLSCRQRSGRLDLIFRRCIGGIEMHIPVRPDSEGGGLAQINLALVAHKQWQTIHACLHSAARVVRIGDPTLDFGSLRDHAVALRAIGANLVRGGDILLFGRDVAQGSARAKFIAALALATGADVAASIDLTGAASRGGDWLLEAGTGPVISASLESSFVK